MYSGGYQGSGQGGSSRPLGKNMSNEEYLERQSEINRLKRMQAAQSRERLEKQKVQERESGFNVYLSGANEKRIADQRLREKYGTNFAVGGGASSARQSSQNRSGSRSSRHVAARQDSKGARRRWIAPADGGNAQEEDSESVTLSTAKKSNYQNPFSIEESTQSQVSPFGRAGIPRPVAQPSSKRKPWGVDAPPKEPLIGSNFLDSNTPDSISRKNNDPIKVGSLNDPPSYREESKHGFGAYPMSQPLNSYSAQALPSVKPSASDQAAGRAGATTQQPEDEESDYSDSFEEVNNTVETVQKQDIEDLLKTATEDQLNILKESLGNWADLKRISQEQWSQQFSDQKQPPSKGSVAPTLHIQDQSKQGNKDTIDEDDYIEEDFEEDNSDSPIEEDPIAAQEEADRLERERQEQLRKASARVQSTRNPNKPARPISATYNLSNNLSRPQVQSQSLANLGARSGVGQASKKADTLQNKQAMIEALEEENRRAVQSRRPAASATQFKGVGAISSLPSSEQQSHQQYLASGNLDAEKKAPSGGAKNNNLGFNQNNPFATNKGRPISQMLPKRSQAHQKSKTANQGDLPKIADMQNFMVDSEHHEPQAQYSHRQANTLAVPTEERHFEQDTTFTRSDLQFDSRGPLQKKSLGQGSTTTASISDLLAQIQRLEDSQRHQLFLVLKDMEVSGDMSASNLQRGLQQFLVRPENANANNNTNTNSQAKLQSISSKTEVAPMRQPAERTHNELCLRVLSTLGNPHVCGLTEIELFDDQAQKVPIGSSCIMVRNQGKGPKVSLDKLVNGQKLTKDMKQMWMGYLPAPPQRLEIVIRFDKSVRVGGLKVWNYNKGILDCTKGVYQLQVLLNDSIQWTGSLSPGKGQVNVDYSKSIILKQNATPDFTLPQEALPESTPSEPATGFGSKKNLTSMASLQGLEPAMDDDSQTQEERLRQYRSKLLLAQGVVPNQASGPIWLDQDPKPMGREQRRQSNLRSDQDKTSVGRGAARQRAGPDSDAPDLQSIVQGAVNSVNRAVEASNSKRRESRKPAPVDESLDSLDYFKVTNLGRFGNTKEDASSKKQQSRVQSTVDKPDAQPSDTQKTRNQHFVAGGNNSIGVESLNNHQSIHSSSRKMHDGPKLRSGALPEEFMMPSPARSIPSRKSKKEQNRGDQQERDLLDDFIGVQVPDPQPVARQANIVPEQTVEPSIPVHEESFKLPAVASDFIAQGRDNKDLYAADQDDAMSIATSRLEAGGEIPTLPEGKKLEINILETWGDMNYLGLTGIEVFDERGAPIEIHESQVLAFPPDVNVLPGYGSDPRTVDKLVDGQHFTNDDLHVWLTPFTSGEDHQISINLGRYTGLSMIRIWNYNKSRIHSFRGAKLVSIELDGKCIFRGEIRKAPGNTKNPEDCCEVILFSEEDSVLQNIDANDWLNDLDIAADEFDNTQRITEFQIQEGQLEERPMTATKKFTNTELEDIQFQLAQQRSKPTSLFDERPSTSAIVQSQRIGMPAPSERPQLAAVREEEDLPSHRPSAKQPKKPGQGVRGQVIFINITLSWGDLFYVGLNGLEVLDERGFPIPITVDRNQRHPETNQISKTSVHAEPRDMNAIPGHGQDHRTLEKLFNGKNNTTDDRDMWLVPFNSGEDHTIKIDLGEVRVITGLRFFNYNKSSEDTLRGAKQVIIKLDDKLMTPKKGITLRVAPGTTSGIEDISQTVKLPFSYGWANEQIIPVQRSLDSSASQVPFLQEYEPIAMPMGFMFKLNLYSTHGDLFYIGLNGVELFDQNGFDVCRTRRDQCRIYAYPEGVHTLQGMANDIRVVSNTLDGENETAEDNHIWLTPYKNTKGHANASAPEKESAQKREPNFIVLLFEQPVALSALRLWNYSKTPARGVNEYELEIDGQKIYRGFARQASEQLAANRANSTVVLFQGDSRHADSLGRQINFNPSKVQNVLLMNERKQMNAQHQKAHVNEKFVFDEQLRPQTKALFK